MSTEEAAVSNKVILTFDLSASSSSPITKYTDTAEIFVGKYSNISTNILDTFKKFTTMDSDALSETTDTAHPIKNLTFDFSGKKSYLYYYEGEPNYHLIFFLKQGKWDNNLGK